MLTRKSNLLSKLLSLRVPHQYTAIIIEDSQPFTTYCSITEGIFHHYLFKLYQKKRVRAIGVSNFSVDDIKSLIAATGFVPHVNQIPFYVGKPQKELREYCCQNNILVEAYSPLMSGRIFKIKLLDELATKYNVTPAQIALRYTIEQGTLPLPKSTHIERMKENIALDFDLQIADVESLGNIGLKSKSRFL
ncbi:MAG: aldo/keto reductase [Bacteroidia bacterium]|nr:aldo/keto reductase [Bacteroidia bacterium]